MASPSPVIRALGVCGSHMCDPYCSGPLVIPLMKGRNGTAKRDTHRAAKGWSRNSSIWTFYYTSI